MRTPVRHNTITAVGRVAPASIALDVVKRNPGRGRELVNFFHETVVGRKRVDAGRYAVERRSRWVRYHGRADYLEWNGRNQEWHPYQPGADFPDPIRTHRSSAMRRANENDARHLRPMIEDKTLFQ